MKVITRQSRLYLAAILIQLISLGSVLADMPSASNTLQTNTNVANENDIVVVVNRDSAINSLTPSEVKKLYLGKNPTLKQGVQLILLDYKSTSPIRKKFCERAIGKSVNYSTRLWARYAFSGRGTPPITVSSEEQAASIVSKGDVAYLAYLHRKNLTPNLKVVFTISHSP